MEGKILGEGELESIATPFRDYLLKTFNAKDLASIKAKTSQFDQLFISRHDSFRPNRLDLIVPLAREFESEYYNDRRGKHWWNQYLVIVARWGVASESSVSNYGARVFFGETRKVQTLFGDKEMRDCIDLEFFPCCFDNGDKRQSRASLWAEIRPRINMEVVLRCINKHFDRLQTPATAASA